MLCEVWERTQRQSDRAAYVGSDQSRPVPTVQAGYLDLWRAAALSPEQQPDSRGTNAPKRL